MTDIVITFLNETPEWKAKFNYYKQEEINKGIIKETSKQAFGEERTRNWEFLKYWFRAVEKNCSWFNKIFIIVQDKSHIPEWINTNCDRLRVVTHDEYVPEELLPTFNSMTICMYISRIKDLSDNYIYCDDDMFFMNPIKEDRFFKDGIAQHEDNRVEYKHYFDGDEFLHIMNNSLDFEEKFMDGEKIKYHFYHLPVAHMKQEELYIIEKNYKDILEKLNTSRFRHHTNIDPNVLSNILKLKGIYHVGENESVYGNCSYIALKPGINYEDFKDKDMICFNDTDLATEHFENIKKELNTFLEKTFPEKSIFER